MRFFIFLLLLLLCLAKTSGLLAEPRSEKPLQLATLFCEKKDKFGNCTYFDKDPGEFLDATVWVQGVVGTCSGMVIQLMRDGKKCKRPLLLTAGHCANPQKLIRPVLHFGNHKINVLRHKVKKSTLTKLQKQCMKYSEYIEGENCLLTPQDILNDETQIKFSGVDQALIPLKNVKANLPSVKIDLNAIVTKDELNECLEKDHEATVVSYLIGEHLDKIGKPEFKTDRHEDYIKADTCNDLSLLAKTKSSIKQRIGHRCPALLAMSGSFLKLDCETQNKIALLVLEGERLKGVSEELKAKAEEGESILPSEYEGKDEFKNTATYIDPKLLELYVDEYCGFPNPPH